MVHGVPEEYGIATKYRAGKRSLFTPKTLILMMREYDEGVLGNERQ